MEKQDSLLPEPIGDLIIEPFIPDEKWRDFFQQIDEFFLTSGLTDKPSAWVSGALFASQSKLLNNPDWIAQATHSLREVIYRLMGERNGGEKQLRELLSSYGPIQELEFSVDEMKKLWDELCDIAHHRDTTKTEAEFKVLLSNFENVIATALRRQVDVHQKVDEFLSQDPS